MRWRLTLSVLLGAAVITVCGQPSQRLQAQTFGTEIPADVELLTSSPGLIPGTRVASVQLILGRLSLDPTVHIKGTRSQKVACPSDDSQQCCETVEISACRGIPSILYRLDTPWRNVVFDVRAAEQVHIESRLHVGDELRILRITQHPGQALEVSFVVQADQRIVSEQTYKVNSFVHLQAQQPRQFNEHLHPLFCRLLPNVPPRWSAKELLKEIEATNELPTSLSRKVQGHLDELRSTKVATRNRAERDLVQLGLVILPLLEAIAPDSLDAEQRRRIRSIRNRLQPSTNDTTTQVASWLAADLKYWNLVAADLTELERERLDHHLVQATGRALAPQVRVADGGLGTTLR